MVETTLLALAVSCALLTFVLPPRFGLALALALFVLVPRPLYAGSEILETLPPAYFVLIAWMVRLMGRRARAAPSGRRTSHALTSVLLISALWYAATLIWSINPTTSLSWLVPFTIGAVLLYVFARDRVESIAALRAAWVVMATVVALYAFVEFSLSANPLWDPLYQAVHRPLVQKWAVYRVHASFGHPLYAALFFAVSAALAFGHGISQGKKLYVIAGLISAAAVVVTFSRAGVVGVTGVLVLQTVIAIFSRTRMSSLSKLTWAVVLPMAAFAVFQLPQVEQRFLSDEAEKSTDARDGIASVAQAANAAYNYVGSGIGTSSAGARPYNPSNLLIENGYYQLLISSGVVGVVLFGLILATGLMFCLRSRDLAGIGAVGVFAVMIGTFNALESNPGVCLLLGMILLVAVPVNRDAPMVSAPRSARSVNKRPVRRSVSSSSPSLRSARHRAPTPSLEQSHS